MGRGPRQLVRPADRDGAAADRHRARPAQPRAPPLGLPAREPEAPGRPPAGGLRRLSRAHRRPDRPLHRLPRAAGRAGQHLAHPAVRQRRQSGGRPLRRHARDEVLQLPGRGARRGGRTHRRHRRPPQPCQLPWGWAQAGNTPFKWYKQNTHEGGVHVPLIVHWPQRITGAGTLRDQFHHVDDIVPTIYETLGIEAPATYRGLEQIPLSGVPLAYTFDATDAPTNKHVQYFEMMGHRGIYAHGWKAITRHQPGVRFEDDEWELYHLTEDRSECHNLAAEMPDKVAALIQLWWREAEEYGVLPLDDRTIELFFTRYRDHSPHPVDRHYSYFPPTLPLIPI